MSVKISDLPPTQFPLVGDELIEIVQDGLSKKATAAQFQAPAAYNADFVVMALTGLLPNERVLTAGDAINITDGGANNPVTVSVPNLGITTAKLADDAATNAKLADMDQDRLKGRVSAGTGDPEDLTQAQVLTFLGLPVTPADVALLSRNPQTFLGQNIFSLDGSMNAALGVSSINPWFAVTETDEGVDAKEWRWGVNSRNFRLFAATDADPGLPASTPISVQRAAASVVIDEIEFNATVLDVNAASDFEGQASFRRTGVFGSNISSVQLSSNDPVLELFDENAAADSKRWTHWIQGGTYVLALQPDVGAGSVEVIRALRTGLVIDEIELNATLLDVNANLDVEGSVVALNNIQVNAATIPTVRFNATGGDADEKFWEWEGRVSGGTTLFQLRARTDALGLGSTPIVLSRTGTVIDEIEFNATLVEVNGRFEANVGVVAAGSLSSFSGSGVAARIGVANALLSAGTDVFVGRPSGISGFVNGDLILQSFAGSVNIVVGGTLYAEFLSTDLVFPESNFDIVFAGTTGPNGIEWQPSDEPASDGVRMSYRTTPESVSIERNSDDAIFFEFIPASLNLIAGQPIRFPDGAVGAPAMTFNSDPDNGIYLSGTNEVSISTAGTQRVAVQSNGTFLATGPMRTNDGRMYLSERASGVDIAGLGQLWVLNNTPNLLMFSDDAGSVFPMQYSNQKIQNGNYTFVWGDIGNYLSKTSGGGGEQYTIPSDATSDFPSGSAIGIDNRGGGNLTIAPAGGVTLLWPAGGGTGNRVLGDDGFAVIFKVGNDLWSIAGDPLS